MSPFRVSLRCYACDVDHVPADDQPASDSARTFLARHGDCLTSLDLRSAQLMAWVLSAAAAAPLVAAPLARV